MPGEPLCVAGDPTRLAQVVLNLLNNAAKYTPEGGHLRLAVTREGDLAAIRLRDDGDGIPAEMLPRIFDLFVQVDRSIARSLGGLGIGLTLVKRLVEIHGGTVEARSDGTGKGSEFIVRLPLIVPATPTCVADGPSGIGRDGSTSPRRVLVVDADRESAEALAQLLHLLGHEVETAPDGPSALRAAPRFTPDLVLLDLGHPGIDGHEVARRLRSEPSLDGVRLVALAGHSTGPDHMTSEPTDFDEHLVKPVELDDLLVILEEAQLGKPRA
jgi:CheY-like chemotaxis protein